MNAWEVSGALMALGVIMALARGDFQDAITSACFSITFFEFGRIRHRECTRDDR